MTELKAALLRGTAYLEDVEVVNSDGEELIVKVRPLSSNEAGEVSSLSMGGLAGPMDSTGKVSVNVDLGKFTSHQEKADIRAVRYGLSHSNTTWTDEEAGSLTPKVLKPLSEAIFRISGISRPQVESFRGRVGTEGPGDGARDGNVGA